MNCHPSPVTHHSLFDRIVLILEQARSNVVRSVNSEMVHAYWYIGREIVQELQGGEERAEYGKRLIQDLSAKLTAQYGKGFSLPNLKLFRQFYSSFADRSPGIGYTACSQSKQQGFSQNLGWSHYRVLMRVVNLDARSFYEAEADQHGWSVSQLERQKNSFFYERLLRSKDKKRILARSSEKDGIKPIDVMKDPYVLEFLNLPEPHSLSKTKLETALIS